MLGDGKIYESGPLGEGWWRGWNPQGTWRSALASVARAGERLPGRQVDPVAVPRNCFAGVDPVKRGRVLQELTCLSRNRQTLLPGCGQHSGQLVALMCVGAGNLVAGNDTLGARRKCQFD